MIVLPLRIRRALLKFATGFDVVFRRISFVLLRAMSAKRNVNGIELVDATGDAEGTDRLSVESALRLIADHDPRRYTRIGRDVERIILTPHGGPEYLHFARACLIGASDVRQQSPVRVAMTIVHEATHARLGRAGLDDAWHWRERIERRCVEEEIAFARRVPGTAELIAAAQHALSQPWYSEQQLFERKLQQLHALGRPNWIVALYRALLSPASDS